MRSAGSGDGPEGDVAVTLKDFSIDRGARHVRIRRHHVRHPERGAERARVRDLPIGRGARRASRRDNGLIPEDQVDLVDEAEDIAPGTNTTLSVNLAAGSTCSSATCRRTTRPGCTRGSPVALIVSLFLPTRPHDAYLHLSTISLGLHAISVELTALNLQSIFRCGPAEARARTGNGTSAVTSGPKRDGPRRSCRGTRVWGRREWFARRRGPSLFVSERLSLVSRAATTRLRGTSWSRGSACDRRADRANPLPG